MYETYSLFSSERRTDCPVLVLSVDLRDAVGDRLYLSKGFHRDGVSRMLPCFILTLPQCRPCLILDKLLHLSESLVELPVSVSYLFRYREHAEALTARQAIAESRKSRGFLSGLFRRSQDLYKPTYNYVPDGSACRIYGSLAVKKVTGIYLYYVRPYPSSMRGLLTSKSTHHYRRPWL